MRIHTGGDFDIFSHEGASPYLLVTFNEVGRLGDGAYYWGRPVVEAKNISTVAVVTRKADWFRNPEIDAYLKANPQLFSRQKDVVAVGYSMGGYGAIKYSRMVGAATVIAFCAQYTMDPALLDGRDSRAPHKYFNPAIHRDMQPRAEELAGEIYLFYDPHFEDDIVHVEKFQALGGASVHPVAVPFADHEAHFVFGDFDAFARLIDLCRAGNLARIRAHVAAERRNWRLRPVKVAIAAAMKRPDLAIALHKKYEAAFRPFDLAVLGNRLSGRRPRIAEQLLKTAIERDPSLRPYFERTLSAVSRKLGLAG